MSPLHPHQSRASLPRRRLAQAVPPRPVLVATPYGEHPCPPQLLGHRVPIASRAFSFPRKLACQGQFTRIYRKLLKHIKNYVSEALHCHFSNRPFAGLVFVGFDANENGLTYAKRSFASGAKEND